MTIPWSLVDQTWDFADPAGSEIRFRDALTTEYDEASNDPRARRWVPSLLNNIGWTLHDRAEYQAALGIFETAVDWRISLGQRRESQIARWTVARVLRSLNRVDEALAIHNELARE